MLDPSIIRDKPDVIRNMLLARGVQFDIDGLLQADQDRRTLIVRTDDMRRQRNQMGQEISGFKKRGEDASGLIAQMRDLLSSLQVLETKHDITETKYQKMSRSLPNLLDSSVPIGSDDKANVVMHTWGKETPTGLNPPKNHIDICEKLDLLDLQRAAKVAGSRFYYLKGDLVRLNHALIRFALDFLAKREYTPIQPPYMITRESMEGAIIADDFEDVIYKIDDEDLYMIGTSEHAMAAMHSDEILEGASLPIRYGGTSPCFRKEAGAHGRDQKGIFRVHQFEKVEQFVFTRPEESQKEHEKMLQTAEEFYEILEIPYRTVLLSSGDMGKVSSKTYDIEAWMAGQNAYREIVSCSNCLEYQARRLKIRFRDKTNEDTRYVHTLNSTLVATTRVLVAIIENMQTTDGHFKIPTILQGYMNGQKEI